MEEELSPSEYESITSTHKTPPLPIAPTGLSPGDVEKLSSALLTAKHPLIITSHIGKNVHAISPLLALSGLLAIPIFCSCPTTLNVPFSHPYLVGITYLNPGPPTEALKSHLSKADVVIVLESDLPWLPLFCSPGVEAKVFIIDSADPLKTNVGTWELGLHPGVQLLAKADAQTALEQVLDSLHREMNEEGVTEKVKPVVQVREDSLKAERGKWVERLDEAEALSGEANVSTARITVPHIMRALRTVTHKPKDPLKMLLVSEAISNYGLVWEHVRPETPGSVLTSGGSSLGYALGACVGAHLGEKVMAGADARKKHDLIVAVVGDGSYMFGVPSSAYWIARRYNTPFLTIVLNNGGWKVCYYSFLDSRLC